MNIRQMVIREIGHRKISFILGLLSVAGAVGCLTATRIVVESHATQVQRLREQAETETVKEMAGLEEDVDKAMLHLGFDVAILPKDQDLANYYAEDYASKLMPEEYVNRLKETELSTIEQPLAVLRQRLKWPEKDWTILLVGTGDKGDANTISVNDPLADPIPPGNLSLGYELHRGPGLKGGDAVRMMNQTFKVYKCYEQLGTKDDVTVWINLSDAQEILGKQGWINEIRAVKRLGPKTDPAAVRSEVSRILPETQVIADSPKNLTRTLIERYVPKTGESAVSLERKTGARMTDSRRQFAIIVSSSVVFFSMVWVGSLAFANVRARREEIGALRAMGFRSGLILSLFLSRAVIMGTIGWILGYPAGVIVAARYIGSNVTAHLASEPTLIVAALFITVGAAAAASLLPALLATHQDPATILRKQ